MKLVNVFDAFYIDLSFALSLFTIYVYRPNPIFEISNSNSFYNVRGRGVDDEKISRKEIVHIPDSVHLHEMGNNNNQCNSE